MKIIGYHNTESDNVEDIITNGFKYRKNEKHWLGQGIYFFDNLDMAFRNIDMLDHEKDIKTIVAEINVTVGVHINSNDVCNIKVTMAGFFRVEVDSAIGKSLLLTNTVAILFPYIRSQLTLLTSQPGFDSVILPVMNINALFAGEE